METDIGGAKEIMDELFELMDSFKLEELAWSGSTVGVFVSVLVCLCGRERERGGRGGRSMGSYNRRSRRGHWKEYGLGIVEIFVDDSIQCWLILCFRLKNKLP